MTAESYVSCDFGLQCGTFTGHVWCECRLTYKNTKNLKNLQESGANACGICICELFFVHLHCISTNGMLLLMKFAIRWTLAFIIFTLALICTACNVTRTITTTSTAYQRGDTSVIIQTKTTETYDGTLKYNQFKR